MTEEIEVENFKALFLDMYRGFPRWLYGKQVEDIIPTKRMREELERRGFLVIEREQRGFKYSLGPNALLLISAWGTEKLTLHIMVLTLFVVGLTILTFLKL